MGGPPSGPQGGSNGPMGGSNGPMGGGPPRRISSKNETFNP